MHWDVVKVCPKENLSLEVKFADGTQGIVHFKPAYFTGVFKPLSNPDFFASVFVDGGVVSWAGELDLAPDAMYKAIKKNGTWVLS